MSKYWHKGNAWVPGFLIAIYFLDIYFSRLFKYLLKTLGIKATIIQGYYKG